MSEERQLFKEYDRSLDSTLKLCNENIFITFIHEKILIILYSLSQCVIDISYISLFP